MDPEIFESFKPLTPFDMGPEQFLMFKSEQSFYNTKKAAIVRAYANQLQEAAIGAIQAGSKAHLDVLKEVQHAYYYSHALPEELSAAAFVLPHTISYVAPLPSNFQFVGVYGIYVVNHPDGTSEVKSTAHRLPLLDHSPTLFQWSQYLMHRDAIKRINDVAGKAGWHEGKSSRNA